MKFLSRISFFAEKVRYRCGCMKPAWLGVIPNLPYLPHVSLSHTHMYARARTCSSLYQILKESKVSTENVLFIMVLMILTIHLGWVRFGISGPDYE